MPVTFDVETIIEDARQRCDFDEFTSVSFVTEDAVLEMIKESAWRLSGVIRSFFGQDYFLTSSDVSTTAGVAYVALPANATTLHRVVWVRGADDFVEVERAQIHDTNAWTGGWSSRAPLFQLRYDGVHFFPTPDAVYTVRLTHDTGIVVVDTSTTISGDAGWREWLTLDLCSKFRQREEKSPAEFVQLQQVVEASIKATAPRNRAGTVTVRDVDAMPQRRRPWDRWT